MLPPEFAFLNKAQNELDLFNMVSEDLTKTFNFLPLMLDDEEWCDANPEFIKKIVRWLTERYYYGHFDIDTIETIAEIFHKYSVVIAPYLLKDIELKVKENSASVNSLLLAASSPYFFRLMSFAAQKKQRELHVDILNPRMLQILVVLIQEGKKDLWRVERDDLKEIVKQSQVWEMYDIHEEAQKQLIKYLSQEEAKNNLIESLNKKWVPLSKASAEAYNKKTIGLKLYVDDDLRLTCEFHDLISITTLAEYEELAPYTSICKFTGSLAGDPDFNIIISKATKLIGIDLSNTSIPPYSLNNLPRKLERAYFERASWINDEWFETFGKKFHGLTHLGLQDDHWLSVGTWVVIAELSNLQHLNLEGQRFLADDDVSLFALQPLGLEYLNLSGCKSLTSKGIQILLEECPRLIELDLSHTVADDRVISDVLTKLPQLKSINLSNTFVSDKSLKLLKKRNL